MKFGKALTSAASVAVVANATGTGFPPNSWAYAEYGVGIVWGAYVPFRQFSGEFDCQSALM